MKIAKGIIIILAIVIAVLVGVRLGSNIEHVTTITHIEDLDEQDKRLLTDHGIELPD